jgi:predicted Zn-dependent peptidase
MKRWLLIAVMVVSATTALQAPMGGLKLPSHERLKLPNGMTLLLMERHELPLISFHVIVKAGGVADPAGQEGLASLTAALLRKGTKTRSANQFSAQLDFVGGQFNANSAADFATLSAQFMKKDVGTGLDLLADALLNATFPQEEVDKLIQQRVDGIKAAKDQALAVVPLYFHAYLYGRHPYARPTLGDEKSLPTITRDAIVKFYRAEYTPGNTILAVAGDFDRSEMERMLSQTFGAWPGRQAPAIAVPDPADVGGRRLLLVDKPDATQTYYSIGNVGISRTNPDRVPIRVVNTVFGGRFASMLNTELRIRSGLTYGASSYFDERKSRGPFVISSYTRTATTEKAMDLTLEVIKRLHEKGVTQEELDLAKNYIKGQFPPTIETSGQLAGQLAELESYGLDEREINDLYPQIDAMTLGDAQRVIRQYFPLDNLAFVVIGKAAEIGTVVRKYAPQVDTVSITQTGFGTEAARTRALR